MSLRSSRPSTTQVVEDLIHELKNDYTIMVVTHNMQQAARVADMTAFFSVQVARRATVAHGILVEYGPTPKIFIRRPTKGHGGLCHREVRLDTDERDA